MGLIKWLARKLGDASAPTASLNMQERAGCWWNHPQVLPLAAGRGFTTEVVGESQWQENIGRVVGGKCPQGHKREVAAQLVFEDNPKDRNAVGVMIDAGPVGWIAREDAAQIRKEVVAINPDRLAMTCKAKIVGGWDDGEGSEGSFGVRLSLARPLKVDTRSRKRTN